MYQRNEDLETKYDKENFVGKIFESKKCGKFCVIGVHDLVKKNRRYIVEFLNSNHQQLSYKSGILSKGIEDDSLEHPKVGNTYKTQKCGDCIVLEVYAGEKGKRQKAKVKFLNTGYEGIYFLCNIERGEVQDPFNKFVYGVGYLGILSFNPKDYITIYRRWYDMIERVYKEGGHINYKNVSVCNDWHCLQNFYEDFSNIEGYEYFSKFKDIDFDIDKDIIGDGITYSLENCLLIPHDINMLFAYEQENNTSGYAGVSYESGRGLYQVGLSIDGKRKFLGRVSSPEEGYKIYIKAKLNYCDEILSKYDFIKNDMVNKIKNSLERKLVEVLNVQSTHS